MTARAAGAELHHGAALGGADDAVGLGGDQALVVDGQQGEGLEQLRLDRGRAHNDHRLLREHGRALGHGVNVAAEVEVRKVVKELLADHIAAAEVFNVLLVKVQIFDIVDQLVEPCGDGVAAAVRHGAEINVEIGNAILESGFQNVVVIVLFCVIPMIAWAATLLAMKNYSLTGEKMKEIQAVNACRRDAVANGMKLEEAMEKYVTIDQLPAEYRA